MNRAGWRPSRMASTIRELSLGDLHFSDMV